jgi:hypothetical protein
VFRKEPGQETIGLRSLQLTALGRIFTVSQVFSASARYGNFLSCFMNPEKRPAQEKIFSCAAPCFSIDFWRKNP